LITLIGGVITLGVVAWITALIGLVEGVIYLTKSDSDFAQIYVRDKRAWF
jgi:hypothetical protein